MHSIKVDLTPELAALVESKVKSGRYVSASEMIRQALLLLEQQDAAFTLSKDEIRKLIDEGWKSAKRGELVNGNDAFDRLDAELAARERTAVT